MPAPPQTRLERDVTRLSQVITVPGMERLGALPSGTMPLAMPPGLMPPTATQNDIRAMIGNYGVPPTPEQAQRNVELTEAFGSLIPEGVAQMGSGAYDFPSAPLRGAAEFSRGLMKTGTPIAAGALVASPLPVLAGMAVGTGVGYGATKTATAMGATLETAQDIGDITALASGLATGIPGIVRRGSYARIVSDINRKLEIIAAKIPKASPAEAEVLRAQASGLSQAASEMIPQSVVTTPPEIRGEEPPKVRPGLEPKVASLRDRQLVAQTPPPEVPATPPRAPSSIELPLEPRVETVHRGQLGEEARLKWEFQQNAGIAQPLGSEAGVLSLPSRAEMGAARQRFMTNFFDEYTPIHDLAARGILTAEDNPYIAVRMYAGHYGKIWNRMNELRSIWRPVTKAGLKNIFERQLELERDVELFNRPDIGPEYRTPLATSLNDAQQQLFDLRASVSPEERVLLDTKALQLRNPQRTGYYDRMLREFKDSGMLGADAYGAIVAGNEKYVPFHRLAYMTPKEIDAIPRGGRMLDVPKQNVVKAILGSESDTAPILPSTLRNLSKMVAMSEKNRAMRKLADLSQRPEWEQVVRPLERGEELGPNEGKFSVFEDGEKHEYAVPKLVEQAIHGMAPYQMSPVERIVNFTNQGIRSGATLYYLPFIAKNIIRDYRTVLLRSPFKVSPVDLAKGFADAMGRGADFQRYMESGAAQSGFFERSSTMSQAAERITESQAKRVLRHAVNPFAMMRLLSEVAELGPRKATFDRALFRGMSDTEAGWLARNITVDFSNFGRLMKWYNAMVPFMNARIHGTANMFSAFRDQPMRASLMLATTSVMPALLAYYNNRVYHADTWAKIPQTTRDLNHVWVWGDKTDQDGRATQVFKLPKSDTERNFINPITNFLDNLYETNPRGWWDVFVNSALDVVSDVSPVGFRRDMKFSLERIAAEAAPAAITAPFELGRGERGQDFYTGAYIEPGFVETRPATPQQERYNAAEMEGTLAGKALIQLSRLTGGLISPADAAHLARRFGAGTARSFLMAPPSEAQEGKEPGVMDVASQVLGLQALKQTFTGAPGYGKTERESRELDPHAVEEATRYAQQMHVQQRIVAQVKNKPLADQVRHVMDLYHSTDPKRKIDADTTLRVSNYLVSRAMGTDPEDWAIVYQYNSGTKGLYLADKYEKWPRQKFLDKYKDWTKRGLITDAVMGAMTDELVLRQQTSKQTGPGAAPATPAPTPAPRRISETPTVADRNNNPLNLKGSDGKFRKFSTPEEGWQVGIDDLNLKLSGKSAHVKPSDSLLKLIGTWAPALDPGNDPEAYTEYVATRMHVTPQTKLQQLQGRVRELAHVMSEMEGWNGGAPPTATPPQSRTEADIERLSRALGGT